MNNPTRPTPEAVRELTLGYIRKVNTYKPVLIGGLCLHLGWWATLADAERILDQLVEEGVLRRLTAIECDNQGINHGYTLAV